MRLCSPDHHKVAEELITTHLVNEMMQSSNVLMKTTDSFSDATGGEFITPEAAPSLVRQTITLKPLEPTPGSKYVLTLLLVRCTARS